MLRHIKTTNKFTTLGEWVDSLRMEDGGWRMHMKYLHPRRGSEASADQPPPSAL
jgi:hypothetical protein